MIRTHIVDTLPTARVPRMLSERSLTWDYFVYHKRPIEKLESASG